MPSNPLPRRLPEQPSLKDVLALIKEYADATDERGPHAWFFALCWSFSREFFDLMEESPDDFAAKKAVVLSEFSGLTEFAQQAMNGSSTTDLEKIANGIAALLREVAALRNQRFQ
jgi:hypothetical protein